MNEENRETAAEPRPEEPAAGAAGTVPPEDETSTVFADPETAGNPKRPKRGTRARVLVLSLCAAVLVGAGAVLAWRLNAAHPKKSDGDAGSSSETQYLVNHSADELSGIEIQTQTERYTLQSKADTGSGGGKIWQLKGYEDLKMGTASDVAIAVAQVEIERKMNPGGKASDYGLDKPYVTVAVTVDDGSRYTLTVGNESPDQTGRYATVTGDDAVYLIDKNTAEQFCKSSLQMIDPATAPVLSDTDDEDYFTDGSLNSFDTLTFGGTVRKSPIEIRCDMTSTMPYSLSKPRDGIADTDKISALLSTVTAGISNSGAYVYHPSAKDLQAYGLNQPYSTFTARFGGQTVVFRLGAEKEEGYYPMTVDDQPVIYRVEKSAVVWATYSVEDLRSYLLFMEDVRSVASVTFEAAGKTVRFNLKQDDENDTYTVEVNGKTVSAEQFSAYYIRILDLQSEEYLDHDVTENGDADLKYTIRYTDSKKKTDVIRLNKYTDRRYLFTKNGKGNALVSSTRVDELIQFTDWLLEGKEIPEL